jgi:hypothetical protein
LAAILESETAEPVRGGPSEQLQLQLGLAESNVCGDPPRPPRPEGRLGRSLFSVIHDTFSSLLCKNRLLIFGYSQEPLIRNG